jgi:tetratricopeptide (TPR) repeat protein
MEIDPLNELLAINYAGNLSSRGDYAAGEAILKNLVTLKPDSTTLLRIMSNHAMKSGDLVDAWRYANQSYSLDPKSPVVIQTLANAWEGLGSDDKAEELLLSGLELAGENQNLKMTYFWLLLRKGRLEKANSLLLEQYGNDIDVLPEKVQQLYYFQKGLVSLVAGDKESARNFLEQALNDDSDQSWDGDQVFFVTMSSALNGEMGNAEVAEARLAKAEQMVRRARINGLDDAWIYYTESSIHALRGQPAEALDNLQLAYDRGFRELWPLEMDLRLASVRDEPRFIAIREQIEKDLEEARLEVNSLSLARL